MSAPGSSGAASPGSTAAGTARPTSFGFAAALCAIDGGPGSDAAVRQAASLTTARGEVTVLLVTSHRALGERGSAIGPMRAKEILDRAEQTLGRAGVAHSLEVDPAAPPAEVILDWTAGHDLLAIGAPDSTSLGGAFVKGVADTALERLTIPVLVAREPHGEDDDSFPRTILIASDGLDGSDQLVEFGAALACAHGARLTLAHVLGSASASPPRRIGEQARRLEQELAGAHLLVEAGNAHEAIVAAAGAHDASLIVMSSRGLTGLRVLGSVSHAVVHDAACSVLLVPPARLRGVPA